MHANRLRRARPLGLARALDAFTLRPRQDDHDQPILLVLVENIGSHPHALARANAAASVGAHNGAHHATGRLWTP